ncbi:MAG TPA: hypothetical protein VKN35_13115 [Xanthomonadales bacterium]|nr:hypothetical protein [Xanthomonadales bacterium]
MNTFPGAPKVAKGGIVLVDARSGKMLALISLQYNPLTLKRTYEVQRYGDGKGPTRLKGPAIETLNIEADIDATDQLEFPEQHENAVTHGIQPQLAALEALINPSSEQLNKNNRLASSGTLELAPMEAPMALFVWSKNRIVPVRITSFSITEESFDTQLNPIQATVTLGMQVLSVTDLGFNHKGGSLFMNYLQNKEQLASKATGASLADFGINSLPV